MVIRLLALVAVFMALSATPCKAANFNLVWSANDPIENVTWYKIYYGSGVTPPFVTGITADQGLSPINVGNRTSTTVSFAEMPLGTVLCLAATAGNDFSESDYSEVVCTAPYDGSDQTFILSASAGEGGTVEPYGDNLVPYGTDFTFRFFADLGYSLNELYIDEMSVDPQPEYTFWDVGQNHSIIPIFQPEPIIVDPPPDDTTTDPPLEELPKKDSIGTFTPNGAIFSLLTAEGVTTTVLGTATDKPITGD
ncbi:MAG: hypothetical protein WC120_03220, partial [Parcubacteria group bacterium]